MKKILIVSLLLSVLCLCSCKLTPFVQEGDIKDTAVIEQKKSVKDKLIKSIEDEYNEESKKDEYITTVGMIELANKYAGIWEKTAEEYREKIIIESGDKSDSIKEKLTELKNNYEKYLKTNLEIRTEIYNSLYGNGSISGPIGAVACYELKKEYALELVEIYEQMTLNAQ